MTHEPPQAEELEVRSTARFTGDANFDEASFEEAAVLEDAQFHGRRTGTSNA